MGKKSHMPLEIFLAIETKAFSDFRKHCIEKGIENKELIHADWQDYFMKWLEKYYEVTKK